MNVRMAQKAIVRGIALACGVALAAPSPALAEAGGGGTMRTFDSTFRSLNPAVQSGAATGVPGVQLFAGLVTLDKNFKPQPYLAAKWEIAPDGLTYTFQRVPDAIFHDGKPITSEDVAFSLDIMNPLTRILMLEKRDMDYAAFADVRPSDAKRIAANKALHLTTDSYSGIGFIDCLEVNLRKKPFDDVRVANDRPASLLLRLENPVHNPHQVFAR